MKLPGDIDCRERRSRVWFCCDRQSHLQRPEWRTLCHLPTSGRSMKGKGEKRNIPTWFYFSWNAHTSLWNQTIFVCFFSSKYSKLSIKTFVEERHCQTFYTFTFTLTLAVTSTLTLNIKIHFTLSLNGQMGEQGGGELRNCDFEDDLCSWTPDSE